MLIKKSITLKKHRTSLSLEIEFWEALYKIAENEKSSIQSLISEIDINRKSSLASSTRVFILQYYKHI
ncbi:ribbon-helix-helix domain-containing protein [Candidatus Levibacter sp. Uisw_134_01]|uniref:ribbon-helix-helix domain-containing protein n=1 Tax=Candidatus Levibacter sp. Uisw_134_01 TaxID=3230999 RepID=UPI003D4A8B97